MTKFSYEKCADPVMGCSIYQDGEEVLKTIFIDSGRDRHDRLAKVIVDMLNEKFSGKKPSNRSKPPQSNSSVDSEYLDWVLTHSQDLNDLSDFEERFVSSNIERLEKYGKDIFISDKQKTIFDNLHQRIKDSAGIQYTE